MVNPLSLTPVPLPKVEAPSIDGLILKVPAAKVPTPDDVMARLEEHRRAHAVATQKKTGDAIGPFDEVCVDLIGYANGKLVPGSAMEASLRFVIFFFVCGSFFIVISIYVGVAKASDVCASRGRFVSRSRT